jgi:hypothetical protein
VQGLIVIGVAAPSTPGFFGPFEFAGKIGMAIYAVPEAPVVVWVLGFHILSWIPISVIGGWYLTRMKLSVADFRRAGQSDAPTAGAT